MYEIDLLSIKEHLVEIALGAGKRIKETSGTVEFIDKKNGVDLVTKIDKEIEVFVSDALKERYPEFEFCGEESYVSGTQLTDGPVFIVDPIDGTTNFIHFFPNCCISLGFAYQKVPLVGVIYSPFLDVLYTGAKGHGSYVTMGQNLPLRLPLLNPSPLKLQSALCAIEWGSDRSGKNFKVKSDTFKLLAAEEKDGGAFVHGFRSTGSAALNLASVAAGSLDCYWEGGLQVWDVCAGWVILEEAGGKIVGGNPGEWKTPVNSRIYLAIRGGERQDEFISEFWKHIRGKLDY
jgi:myo-inositol-1(or 4)-monophosphatase